MMDESKENQPVKEEIESKKYEYSESEIKLIGETLIKEVYCDRNKLKEARISLERNINVDLNNIEMKLRNVTNIEMITLIKIGMDIFQIHDVKIIDEEWVVKMMATNRLDKQYGILVAYKVKNYIVIGALDQNIITLQIVDTMKKICVKIGGYKINKNYTDLVNKIVSRIGTSTVLTLINKIREDDTVEMVCIEYETETGIVERYVTSITYKGNENIRIRATAKISGTNIQIYDIYGDTKEITLMVDKTKDIAKIVKGDYKKYSNTTELIKKAITETKVRYVTLISTIMNTIIILLISLLTTNVYMILTLIFANIVILPALILHLYSGELEKRRRLAIARAWNKIIKK